MQQTKACRAGKASGAPPPGGGVVGSANAFGPGGAAHLTFQDKELLENPEGNPGAGGVPKQQFNYYRNPRETDTQADTFQALPRSENYVLSFDFEFAEDDEIVGRVLGEILEYDLLQIMSFFFILSQLR